MAIPNDNLTEGYRLPALSDNEIAEVANYVTERFGAVPSHVTERDVEKLRTGG